MIYDIKSLFLKLRKTVKLKQQTQSKLIQYKKDKLIHTFTSKEESKRER